MVGVQWHPEDTAADDPDQQRLFDAFVAAAGDPRHRPSFLHELVPLSGDVLVSGT